MALPSGVVGRAPGPAAIVPVVERVDRLIDRLSRKSVFSRSELPQEKPPATKFFASLRGFCAPSVPAMLRSIGYREE
jgi:hypothetical protein